MGWHCQSRLLVVSVIVAFIADWKDKVVVDVYAFIFSLHVPSDQALLCVPANTAMIWVGVNVLFVLTDPGFEAFVLGIKGSTFYVAEGVCPFVSDRVEIDAVDVFLEI